MSTMLFIDTGRRALNVYTVAVTEVPGRGLVLRYGTEVGRLEEFGDDFRTKFPIIVSLQGYQAQSSAGFVELVGGESTTVENVVGIQGFACMGRSKALRPLREPISVRTYPIESTVRTLERNRSSNRGVAKAALEGLRLRAKIHSSGLLLIEGQSDYVKVWEFKIPDWPELAQLKEEHRLDIFGAEPAPPAEPAPQPSEPVAVVSSLDCRW